MVPGMRRPAPSGFRPDRTQASAQGPHLLHGKATTTAGNKVAPAPLAPAVRLHMGMANGAWPAPQQPSATTAALPQGQQLGLQHHHQQLAASACLELSPESRCTPISNARRLSRSYSSDDDGDTVSSHSLDRKRELQQQQQEPPVPSSRAGAALVAASMRLQPANEATGASLCSVQPPSLPNGGGSSNSSDSTDSDVHPLPTLVERRTCLCHSPMVAAVPTFAWTSPAVMAELSGVRGIRPPQPASTGTGARLSGVQPTAHASAAGSTATHTKEQSERQEQQQQWATSQSLAPPTHMAAVAMSSVPSAAGMPPAHAPTDLPAAHVHVTPQRSVATSLVCPFLDQPPQASPSKPISDNYMPTTGVRLMFLEMVQRRICNGDYSTAKAIMEAQLSWAADTLRSALPTLTVASPAWADAATRAEQLLDSIGHGNKLQEGESEEEGEAASRDLALHLFNAVRGAALLALDHLPVDELCNVPMAAAYSRLLAAAEEAHPSVQSDMLTKGLTHAALFRDMGERLAAIGCSSSDMEAVAAQQLLLECRDQLLQRVSVLYRAPQPVPTPSAAVEGSSSGSAPSDSYSTCIRDMPSGASAPLPTTSGLLTSSSTTSYGMDSSSAANCSSTGSSMTGRCSTHRPGDRIVMGGPASSATGAGEGNGHSIGNAVSNGSCAASSGTENGAGDLGRRNVCTLVNPKPLRLDRSEGANLALAPGAKAPSAANSGAPAAAGSAPLHFASQAPGDMPAAAAAGASCGVLLPAATAASNSAATAIAAASSGALVERQPCKQPASVAAQTLPTPVQAPRAAAPSVPALQRVAVPAPGAGLPAPRPAGLPLPLGPHLSIDQVCDVLLKLWEVAAVVGQRPPPPFGSSGSAASAFAASLEVSGAPYTALAALLLHAAGKALSEGARCWVRQHPELEAQGPAPLKLVAAFQPQQARKQQQQQQQQRGIAPKLVAGPAPAPAGAADALLLLYGLGTTVADPLADAAALLKEVQRKFAGQQDMPICRAKQQRITVRSCKSSIVSAAHKEGERQMVAQQHRLLLVEAVGVEGLQGALAMVAKLRASLVAKGRDLLAGVHDLRMRWEDEQDEQRFKLRGLDYHHRHDDLTARERNAFTGTGPGSRLHADDASEQLRFMLTAGGLPAKMEALMGTLLEGLGGNVAAAHSQLGGHSEEPDSMMRMLVSRELARIVGGLLPPLGGGGADASGGGGSVARGVVIELVVAECETEAAAAAAGRMWPALLPPATAAGAGVGGKQALKAMLLRK